MLLLLSPDIFERSFLIFDHQLQNPDSSFIIGLFQQKVKRCSLAKDWLAPSRPGPAGKAKR